MKLQKLNEVNGNEILLEITTVIPYQVSTKIFHLIGKFAVNFVC